MRRSEPNDRVTSSLARKLRELEGPWPHAWVIASARSANAAEDALLEHGQRAVPALAALLTSGPVAAFFHGWTEKSYCRAIAILARLRGPEAAQAIARALEDRRRQVRKCAATALLGSTEPSILKSLIRAANDSDPDVRRAALLTLGTIGSQSALPTLISGLQDSDKEVKKAAISALGEIAQPSSRAALLNVDTQYGFDREILDHLRIAIVRHGISAVSELERVARTDDYEWKRLFAIAALGNIHHPNATAALLDLMPDSRERASIFAALGSTKDAAVVRHIASAVEGQAPAHTYRAAVNALIEIGGAEAAVATTELLGRFARYADSDDQNPYYVFKWCKGDVSSLLRSVDRHVAIASLMRVLEDRPCYFSAAWAIETLASLGEFHSVAMAIDAAIGEGMGPIPVLVSPWVDTFKDRSASLEPKLHNFGTPAISGLNRILRNAKDRYLRRDASKILRKMHWPDSWPDVATDARMIYAIELAEWDRLEKEDVACVSCIHVITATLERLKGYEGWHYGRSAAESLTHDDEIERIGQCIRILALYLRRYSSEFSVEQLLSLSRLDDITYFQYHGGGESHEYSTSTESRSCASVRNLAEMELDSRRARC